MIGGLLQLHRTALKERKTVAAAGSCVLGALQIMLDSLHVHSDVLARFSYSTLAIPSASCPVHCDKGVQAARLFQMQWQPRLFQMQHEPRAPCCASGIFYKKLHSQSQIGRHGSDGEAAPVVIDASAVQDRCSMAQRHSMLQYNVVAAHG